VEGELLRKKDLCRMIFLSVIVLAQSVAPEVDATDVEPPASSRPGRLSVLPIALTGDAYHAEARRRSMVNLA